MASSQTLPTSDTSQSNEVLSTVKISKSASQTATAVVEVGVFTPFRVVNTSIALRLIFFCEMGNMLVSDKISGSLRNLKILFQVRASLCRLPLQALKETIPEGLILTQVCAIPQQLEQSSPEAVFLACSLLFC